MTRLTSQRTQWVCLAAALTAGCTSAPLGRVAEKWRLVGPFRAFSSQPGPDKPATPPAIAPVSGNIQPREPASAPSDASTHGLFDLDATPPDLSISGADGADQIGEAIDPQRHPLFAPEEEAEDAFWYLDLGLRIGVTRIGETEQQLDRRLSVPLALDVFGVFAHPETPLDRKSDFGLTTGYIGIGRRDTEWLTWNFYFGSGVGQDRDHQRWLNNNLDVNFRYALYYTGLTVDIYPWGLSQRGRFQNFVEHLKASRPYAVTGLEIGYLRARGWGRFRMAPLTLYADEQDVEDWLVSYLVGLGWEVPIDDRWAFNVSGHYTFHVYRPEEYNGWNITYALRYRF